MNGKILLLACAMVISGCSSPKTTVAKLDYPLPPKARYKVTHQQFEAAKMLLQQHFSSDTNQLKQIISAPCTCGPVLWHQIKDSPSFVVPPIAKVTMHHPLANGTSQDLPMTLFQTEAEAAEFRAALAELLANNGNLEFRLPTVEEFSTFWAVTPFDTISDPLIVAAGDRYNVIIEFAKGRPFWFDEVKNAR